MNRYLKTLLPLLFILAVAVALGQRKSDPYVYDYRKEITDPAARDELQGYYRKGQQLAQQESNTATTTFLAVGDIMLSRNVAGTAMRAGNPLLPFSNMRETLASVSFTFANLESPFSGSDAFNPSGSMVFNAPRDMVKGLTVHNIKAVTLANNHALDQGYKGIEYTIRHLDDHNIKHTGVATTLTEAWKPAIVESGGIRVCFFGASYSSINDNGKTTNDYVARIQDLESLKASMKSSRSSCDFMAVAMHAGTEYVTQPNQSQVDFARAAIDAGADMVIGHHPHWVQTIEKYNGKYIFYSLGNFVFDQEWSRETKEGLAVKISLQKPKASSLQGPAVAASLVKAELVPVLIENYSTPRLATQEEAKRILDRIGQTETVLK